MWRYRLTPADAFIHSQTHSDTHMPTFKHCTDAHKNGDVKFENVGAFWILIWDV